MFVAPPPPLVTDLQPVSIAKTGAYSTAVAILPARGDAPVRIVAGDQRGGLIVVHRRDGRFGRFARRKDIDVHALAVADLDRDGRDDLVSGGSPGEDGLAVSVRWGARGGALGGPRRLSMPVLDGGAAAWVNELHVADIDGDGRRDIVTGNLVGGSNPRPGAGVAVLHNRGHRRFALRTPTTVRSGEDLVVADLNGDGRRDLLVNGRPYLRRPSGRFVAGRRHDDHAVSFSELADVDADGRADLLYSLNQRLVVRHGAKRGFGIRRFYERALPEAPEGLAEILQTATGDLDGDGKDDLVLAQNDKIDVLRSGPSGVPGTATPHELDYSRRGVAVGDVDGDHRADIATADSSGAVVVLRNRGLRPQSAATLAGRPVLIGADRSVLVDVRCSPGVGHCYGDVTVRARRRSEASGFDIRPGARARVPVPIDGVRTGSRVTIILRGLGGVRQRVRTLVRRSSAADRRRSCRPPGAVVLTQSDIATVITDELGSEATVCLKATGGTIPVPLDYPDGPFALRGQWFVGMGRNCGDGLEGCDIDVLVLNVRSGRTLFVARNVPPFDCSTSQGGDCGDPAVVRIVVGRHGQAAWVTCATSYERGPCPKGQRSILSLDSRGILVIVDRGRIRARSLRASRTGRSFTWVQDGRRRVSLWRGAPPPSRP